MTVTFAQAGTPTVAAGSATAPAPVFPATVNAGDYAVLFVNGKPFSATTATPSGWTLLGSSTNGSVANGADVGSTMGYFFGKECIGNEGGTTVTLAVTSGDTAGAVIHTCARSLGSWATPVAAWGPKVGNSANMSMTTTTQTDVAAGDLMVECFSINSDGGTPSTDTLTQTGVTFGTVTNRSDRAITTGNDSRNRVNSVPVTSVTTPSGGSTGGYANASLTSGLLGVLRLRDMPAAGSAVAATDTVTSSGFVGALATAVLAATVAITAAGVVGTASGGSVAETATVAASGAVGAVSGASLSGTATVASTGNVGTATGTTLSATATITATGSVAGSGLNATASIAATDTITGAGVVGKATGTTIAAADALSAAGVVGASTGTAIAGTGTFTAAGQVGKISSTTVSETATLAAAGQVGRSATATVSETASILAAGQVGGSSTASLAAVSAITATGAIGSSAPTPDPITVVSTRLATPSAVGRLNSPTHTTGHHTPTVGARIVTQHPSTLSTPTVTGAISEL